MKFSPPVPVPQVALRPLSPAGGPLPERHPQPTTAEKSAKQRVKETNGIMEKLTIKTPSDVLSFIGHTLGFWPQESLVCITLNDNGIGATLRIDLPRQPGQELPYARTVAHYLTSDTNATSIIFAVYTRGTHHSGEAKPHAGTIAALTGVLAEQGITIPQRASPYWLRGAGSETLCRSPRDHSEQSAVTLVKADNARSTNMTILEARRPRIMESTPIEE
jgi:hypothetical protein